MLDTKVPASFAQEAVKVCPSVARDGLLHDSQKPADTRLLSARRSVDERRMMKSCGKRTIYMIEDFGIFDYLRL